MDSTLCQYDPTETPGIQSATFQGLGGGFYELYQQGLLTDCKLITSDELDYDIHRIVLTRSSDFFQLLFKYQPDNVIELKTFDSKSLEVLVKFAYTGICHVNSLNVFSILHLANEVQMTELVDLCQSYIKERLDSGNCIGITRITRRMSCFDFHHFLRDYTLAHFNDVIRENEFYSLSIGEIKSFLNGDWLNMSEIQAFHALKCWVEHNVWRRKRYIPQLIKCVRFGLMEPFDLEAHVLPWRHMPRKEGTEGDPFGLRSLVSADRFDEIDLTKPCARPRIPREFIFAIYGWGYICPTTTIEIYDFRAERWIIQAAPEVTPRSYHFVAVVDNKIYLVGGFDGIKYLNLVVCYDPSTQTWENKSCMHHYRCYVTGCVSDGKIYALGGYNAAQGRMSSVERYDVAKNQWSLIAHMNCKRSDASCCVLNGIIYVAGGFDGDRTLRTVEYYNPAMEPNADWYIISDMLTPRSGLTLAPLGNTLYAIGGNDGHVRLTKCEKFTPTFPRKTVWMPISQLSAPRSNASSAVIDDKIYVIGGFDSISRRTTNAVEFYDANYDCWTPAPKMNVRRSSVGACVIRDAQFQYSYLSSRSDLLPLNDPRDQDAKLRSWSLRANMRADADKNKELNQAKDNHGQKNYRSVNV